MERKARLEDGFASMRPIVSLSLFYVLFLSVESLLGERAAAFLPPDAVAFAESVAATASLVGFLLYALVRMRVPGFASLIHASGTLSAVDLLATSLVPGALSLLASGLATMLFVGFAGAAAHEALARRFADGPEIARAVGGAYAAGIVVVYKGSRRSIPRALRPLALAYMVMLCTLSISVFLPLVTAFTWGKLASFLGASFFLTSDGVLCDMLFTKKAEPTKQNFAVMGTYILAQVLLTMGFAF